MAAGEKRDGIIVVEEINESLIIVEGGKMTEEEMRYNYG